MTSRDRARAAAAPREETGGILGELRGFLWLLVTVLVCYAIISNFVGRMYVVPSGSMEPTLHGCSGCTNDRIAVEKVSYYFTDPQPGDVIVFAGPDSWNNAFEFTRSSNVLVRGGQNLLALIGFVPNGENILTKRVIATAGQTVSCQAGDPGVMVDGRVIDASFINVPDENPVSPEIGSEACGGDYFGPVTVPEDSVWVMGDNRTNSADSRAHLGDRRQGTIPLDNVRGKVRFIVQPFSRMGVVHSVDLVADPTTGA